MLIHYRTLQNLETLVVAVDLSQYAVGQHEHGISVPKVHARNGRQRGEAFLLSNDLENSVIVLGEIITQYLRVV